MSEQLTLSMRLRDDATFDNYFVSKNEQVVHNLKAQDEPYVYLFGEHGVGKSHLLQAACQQAAAHQNAVAYLPMSDLLELSGDIFGGLEQMSLICIDDVQLITGHAQWEEALFHFYNRLRDTGGRLVVAANVAPVALNIHLADLQSRLVWGPVLQLHELDDTGKIAALQLRAQGRGFDLPNEVAQFLIRRSARDMASLFLLLDRLDEASLIQQRKLTIPFVRGFIE